MYKPSLLALAFTGIFTSMAWGQGMMETSDSSSDSAQLRTLARSLAYPDRSVVASRPLKAAGVADRSLGSGLALDVRVLTLDNGQRELQSQFTPRTNTTEEITIRADLETDTYTVTVLPVDRASLARDGITGFEPGSARVDEPLEKLFATAICRRVQLTSRDHSGPYGVIRASTTAVLDWRFYSNNGFKCLDVLDRSSSCVPGIGMVQTSCVEVAENNHVDRANQLVVAGYLGTPSGSPHLTIANLTEIAAVNAQGQVTSASGLTPVSENLVQQQIVSDRMYPCSQPHSP